MGSVRTGERHESGTSGTVVVRAASLLFAFRPGEGPLGPSELARRTGLAKSTVARLAGDLEDAGLLERVGRGHQVGLRVFELGEVAARPRDLVRIARAQLLDLRRATGQAVHLAVLEGTEVVYVMVLKPLSGPPIPSRVGGRMPAWATGVGKVLMAHGSEETYREVVATGLPPVGPRSIRSEDALRTELESIRRAGIAYEREESAPDVGCAACPVLDGSGRAIAAVSVSGWSGRLDLRRAGPAVKTAAYGISRLASGPTTAG